MRKLLEIGRKKFSFVLSANCEGKRFRLEVANKCFVIMAHWTHTTRHEYSHKINDSPIVDSLLEAESLASLSIRCKSATKFTPLEALPLHLRILSIKNFNFGLFAAITMKNAGKLMVSCIRVSFSLVSYEMELWFMTDFLGACRTTKTGVVVCIPDARP